jgi:hypothetical protein
MAGDVVAVGGVRVAGDLIGADDVEFLAGLRISAWMDRSIRHDDRGLIVLKQRGQRTNRWLVAGNDGDGAGQTRGAQMFAQRIVRHFTPDQRVAHFARTVADAVRRCDGVFRLDQAQLHLARAFADAALEAGVDRIDLRHDTHVALAVALSADHADRRLVNQVRIGAKLARNTDGLGRAARMAVYEYDIRFCHGGFLPGGWLRWIDNAAGATLAFVTKSNGGPVQAHRLDAPIGH